ncbi:uncharacterized protein TNCV_3786091 [Trichonephila clavipes]|nr:uncharacterized protein TNCV_3786091 [Trichonephila clavipes]
MLNNDEIVTSVQEESDLGEDETDEDVDTNNESSKGPSNADAFSALETAMEWYEQQSECCPTQLLLLKRIGDLAAKKRSRYRVAAVDEWYRYRIAACLVTSSTTVPLKTRRVGQRCTLNLSRAKTSSRWCGVGVRRGGVSSGVVHIT